MPDRRLRLARWGVIAFAIFMLGLPVVDVMLFPDYAQRHYREFAPNDFWTAEQAQAALAELGWPATTIAWYQLFGDILNTLIGGFFALLLL